MRRLLLLAFCILQSGYSFSQHRTPAHRHDKSHADSLNPLLKKGTILLPGLNIRDQGSRMQNYTSLNAGMSADLPSASGSFESLLKTFPGVSSNNELSAQYSVRGGNYDENLIYVNDIEIFRPFLSQQGQQEGLSFINPDLAEGVRFSTGGYGAEYGDKMSSVLDVTYRKPDRFSASAGISILGVSLALGSVTKDHRLSWLLGIRQHSNQFLLNRLDVKGKYHPSFADFQGDVHFKISPHSELSLLGYLASDRYDLSPASRQTVFGTEGAPLQLNLAFRGHERDGYLSSMTALAWTFQPSASVRLKWIGSFYAADEQQSKDINAMYVFGQLQSDPAAPASRPVNTDKGIGDFIEHTRDQLRMQVFTLEHKGAWAGLNTTLHWGLRFQHQRLSTLSDEYSLTDSAGYDSPAAVGAIGYQYTYQHDNSVHTNRYSAFIQDRLILNNAFVLTAGIRATYLDLSRQWMLSPRATLAYRPEGKADIVFRLSSGIYFQPPFYNEYFNYDRNLNSGFRAQQAVHYIASSDWHIHSAVSGLVFFSELYYKQLVNLIPYEINDISIRYLGDKRSHGYAAGLDMRLSGQFVKDLESSFSISFQKTAEKIDGDSHGYIPRPTDQRVNMALFFQDKLTTNSSYKVHLALIYGSRLPIGPPVHLRYLDTLRVPAYRRVDIGFSKEWTSQASRLLPTYIKSVVLYAEVFNLLNIQNTISYLWIRDVGNNKYAVPNYLTSRQLNLKLLVRF